MSEGRFADLKPAELPPVPPLWAAIGPGIVWMALAQGSGELYYWPYFVAKYGALYLSLLIPACVLQMPINLEIGRYTLLTGESVFVGFTRLGRPFGAIMWVFFAVNFIFIGGWVSMGGTALAGIVDLPAGWSDRARTVLWSFVITALFAGALLVGRTAYRVIERFMIVVALVTFVGLLAAASQPQVLAALPDFLRALAWPDPAMALPRNPRELDNFLTMILYSGLGGFWSLFYSFWIREKGFGMAAYAGHITSPITGRKEPFDPAQGGPVTLEGYRFEDTPENASRWRQWMRTLVIDNSIGVLGNLATTLLIALLAFAILHPAGKVPEGWKVAVEQSEFFRVAWGPAGRVVFLVVAGCFLMDAWLAGVDAVSRVHAEMTCTYSATARRRGLRWWYYVFLVVMLFVTWGALLIPKTPDEIVTLTGVMSLFAVAVFSVALWILNVRLLPRTFPAWVRPGPIQRGLFALVSLLYLAAASYYLWTKIR